MADMYLGSQMPMYQNVRIRVYDKNTGEIREERTCKNRITRLMLWGIARFLSGEFNDSTPDKIYEYIPRFLALGSNTSTAESQSSGIKTTVTVNDTRLLNEHKQSSTTGDAESVRRIDIQGRNHNKTTTSFTDSFIRLSLSTYVSSSAYNGLEIGEAGLFSRETGNNCLARVVFAPFTKKETEVIDIQWDITLLSYGITKYPQSVSIVGPNKIKIPLKYSNYRIDHVDIGLYYDRDTHVLYNSDGEFVFTVNTETNRVTSIMDYSYFNPSEAEEPNWADHVGSIPRLGDTVSKALYQLYQTLENSELRGNQFYYTEDSANSKDKGKPTHLYLGEAARTLGRETLVIDSEGSLVLTTEKDEATGASYHKAVATSDPVSNTSYSQAVMMSFIVNESPVYYYTLTGYSIATREDGISQYIQDIEGKETKYVIKDNEVFYEDSKSVMGYTSCGVYLNSVSFTTNEYKFIGEFIDEDRRSTGYFYTAEGYIVKQDVSESEEFETDAYLAWKDDTLSKFSIFEIDPYTYVNDTKYWIDWRDDKEVYMSLGEGDEDTMYHVTNDDYFAIGETHALLASISPSDATDKSVSWSITNKNISKINDTGVLHAWNVGETLAYVTTTNNVKSRLTVEVVRDETIVHTNAVRVTPDLVTFTVRELEIYKYVSAQVIPAISSFNVIDWTLDDDANKIVVMESLGDNEARVKLNGTGNIGRGYLIAQTADGKTAKCLIQVSTDVTAEEDCEDESHEQVIS